MDRRFWTIQPGHWSGFSLPWCLVPRFNQKPRKWSNAQIAGNSLVRFEHALNGCSSPASASRCLPLACSDNPQFDSGLNGPCLEFNRWPLAPQSQTTSSGPEWLSGRFAAQNVGRIAKFRPALLGHGQTCLRPLANQLPFALGQKCIYSFPNDIQTNRDTFSLF